MARVPAALFCVFAMSPTFAQSDTPGIRTRHPLTILSANDGQSHRRVNDDGRPDDTNITEDSISVIHLGPDHPPAVKTVYGTVPNSILSTPYLPMTPDGHYGFVSSRDDNRLSVIDLASSHPSVVQRIEISSPGTGAMHPDGKHLIVPYPNGFRVFALAGEKLQTVRDNPMPFSVDGVTISPSGDRLIAIEFHPRSRVHHFSYADGKIEHLGEVKIKPGLPPFRAPFSPRFSPDGSRVLVLNGGGIPTKGKLDDLLSIDMRSHPPMVTEAIFQLADGMEGVAFHPGGRMAVVACLEDSAAKIGAYYSHLAVIDLTAKPMRLLYQLNIEPLPEGIEFTPDGTQLFVQSTAAHHISVFDVDGFLLTRSPFVIRTGHAPAAMGLAPRFRREAKQLGRP